MSHPDFESRLNDYVDGVLSPQARASTEAHLEGCEECRVEVDQLRALLRGTASLPRSVQPPHDLWPAILEGLDEPERRRARAVWERRHVLAAAAVLLVVISSAVTTLLMREQSGVGEDRFQRLPPQFRPTAAAYEQAATELEEVLEAARDRLSPRTVLVVERNLRIIDDAIAEARSALADDPASREAGEALARRYQDRVDLLQQVGRLLARS